MNGITINGKQIDQGQPKQIKDGDLFSIGPLYLWSFQFPAVDCGDEKPKFLREIDNKLRNSLSKLTRDKDQLDQQVKDGELKQEELTSEKQALMIKLEDERQQFAKKQAEERAEFEQKLSASREETIKVQRQEFERRLETDLKAMELKQREASSALEKQILESESKMASVIQERDEMVQNMEAEKTKVAQQMEEMSARFQEQVEKLKSAFDNEKATAEEYKSAMGQTGFRVPGQVEKRAVGFRAENGRGKGSESRGKGRKRPHG